MAGTRKRRTRSPRVPATQRIKTSSLRIGKTPGTGIRFLSRQPTGVTRTESGIPFAAANLSGASRRKRRY